MALWVKLILSVAALVVVAVGSVFAIGMSLPREHTVTRRLMLKTATPAAVWPRIRNEATASSWRSDVKTATRLPDRNGHEVWREEQKSGETMTFETIDAREPTLFVREIADPTVFGGQWRIDLTAADGGTSVATTETGWVEPPLFRFMARFVFGYAGAMETYLRDLAKSFGERGAVIE